MKGFQFTLTAPNQCINGTEYIFDSWDHGGAQSHLITLPDTPITYKANYLAGNSCSSGACGTALGFDGLNDFVDIPDLTLSGDFTIEAWVYLAPGTTIDQKDGILSSATANHDINFYQSKARIFIGSDPIVANSDMRVGQWTHIAFVRDGNQLRYYHNSTLDKTVTTTWSSDFLLGLLGQTKAGFLQGGLDEIRIWNVARTSTEISNFYDQLVPSGTAGLTAYYRFDENSGIQDVFDQSSNNLNGFLGAFSTAGSDDPSRSLTNGPMLAACGNIGVPDPTVVIISPTPGTTFSTADATINWTVSNARSGDSVLLVLDGVTTQKFEAINGNATFSGLTSGPHIMYAYLLDDQGVTYSANSAKDTTSFIISTSGGSTAFCGMAAGFDGQDDFIEIPDQNISGDFTLEAWILFENGTQSTISNEDGISRSTTSNQDINFFNGYGRIFTGTGDAIVTDTRMRTNQWNHLAFVRSGTTLYVYLNGVLDKTVTNGWTGTLEVHQLGVSQSGFLAGAMDEIRIWNIARSATDLQNEYDQMISPGLAGLQAYYRLDETTGTQTVDDQTANEAHGTLGATSAAGADDPNRFQTSGPMLLACGTTPNTQPAISITQPTNGSIIASSSFTLIYSVVDADTSDEISLTLDGGTPVILAPQNGSYTFTGLANGNHTVVAQVLDENGTPYPNSTAKDTLQISILTGNGNSVCGMDVGFDGVNDIIEIPDLAVFGDFTIESWVYFANGSSSTVTRHDGIFRSVTGNHDINFHQRRPRLYVETDRIIGNTQMRTNRWYHIAFVREGNMLYLYLNGQLDQSVNTSWTGGVDIQQLGGAKAGLLTGKLDEFRVWDLARSQAEIADKSDERILGTSNGLLAYYRFDEGPGMQFVLDQTPNNQHGTLGVSSLSGFDDPARGTTNSPLAATCSQSPIPEPVFILTAPAEGFEAQVSQPVATFTLSDTVVLDSVFVTVNGPSAGTAVISGKTGTYTLPALASGSYEVIFQIVDQSGQPYTNATSADTVNLTVNTTAVCGTAKGFDGTDDFLEIPDITIAGDFTLEAWILFANGPTSSINQNDGIYRSSTSTQDLNFFARKGRIFTGNGDAIVTTTEFRPNQWNHVAFVRSGSYLYVYVNGILDNTQPNGWIGNLEIGQLGKTTSGFLAGALDEVRVWDIARTDIEIAAAFDTVITGNEAGLVAYYRMDEVSQEQLLVDLTETYDGTAGSTSLVGADDPNPFPTTNGFLSAICQPVVLPDPEVTITAPTPGFTFDSDTVSVSFTYNNARVKDSIFWQLDGGAFEVVPDTGGVEFYNVSNGIHTLIGTAQDEDGILYTNPEASDTINFVVNAQQGSSGQQGQCGTAMDFDGSGEVVDIPNLTLNGDFTIEAWIRFTNGAQSTITNADGLLRSTTTEHDINFHQGKPRLYVGHDPIIANTRLRTNRWYHVAFVRSGSTLYCYIDGSLDKTENTTWNGAFRIHELGAAKAGYLNGDLDEVRIWNVARTSTEVFSHYDQLVLPTTPGLVAYYRFDEAFGEQIVNDETPSQFHGTLGADTNASTDDPSRFTTTGAMAQACLTQPTTDPTVVFTAPTQGSTLTQNSAALSFSVANLLATDEVELVFNAGTPISLAPQSATYTFNSLPNGSYTAIIGVKDVGGNTYPNADARDTISFSVQVTGGNTSGNCGMAIGLDGSDDFVEIPDLTLTGDFTIEAWVFLDPAAPLNQEDGILRSTNLNQDINFYNNRPRIFSSGDKIVSQTVIGRGQWNYMAFVRSGTELSFYFNGLEDTSLITNWNGPFEIHQLGRTQAGFLEGAMDEVRIWDVARSYLEIQATFDSELQGTEPGLLAYYQFEKPVGEQVVTDSTNNSYHGSLGANTSIGLDDPIRFPATALLNATLFCSSSNQKNGPRQGILSPTDIPLEFRVFPNPADESVNIQANSSLSEKVLVQVVNALGQEVVSAEMLLENQQSKELSLKNLTSGLYYLNLTVLGQRHTHLLQVQK
ncbi:MAG: LamG-like jellyroll fold domain-containing protein [Bacteroidota bacterium]